MLTPAQQAAVQSVGHTLITACPGSGKTTVLKHRAAFLLSSMPGALLCGVTFTNESASELDRRIREQASSVSGRLTCGTFHSLCKRQLSRAGKSTVTVNESTAQGLLTRAWRETVNQTGVEQAEAVAFVEAIKAQVNPVIPSAKDEPCVLVYDRYQTFLRQMGAMDFSDLLVECVRGMADGSVGPVVTPRGHITHMLVDEFQDIDAVQLAWVIGHFQRGVEITVVGDDDQSIYGFRRALGYEGMELFRKETKAKHIALDLTFRCAQEILAPAAKLIECNVDRVDKQLETANKTPGRVHFHHAYTRPDEVSRLVRQVQASGAPEQWAVLARTNARVDLAEQAFTAYGIPYRRSGGKSFWDARAPGLFLSVCRSLGSGDMVGVDDLLRESGVHTAHLDAIHKHCRSDEPGALERFLETRIKGGGEAFAHIHQKLNDWYSTVRKGNMRAVMEDIAGVILNDTELHVSASSFVVSRDTEMLEQCVDVLAEMEGDVMTRLANLQRKGKASDASVYAHLMTLHASKGLEFDRVWILGCEEGVLPSAKSPDVDEERRLMYVGMTRAKQELHLSCAPNKNSCPSCFLEDAGLLM